MKKLLLVLPLLLTTQLYAKDINKSVEFNDEILGNKVGTVYSKDGYAQMFIIDGSKTVGQFASINIEAIADEQEGGYAVAPGRSLQEFSDNHQFAVEYSVDCTRETITNNNTEQTNHISDMNSFHQTAAYISCQTLKQLNEK